MCVTKLAYVLIQHLTFYNWGNKPLINLKIEQKKTKRNICSQHIQSTPFTTKVPEYWWSCSLARPSLTTRGQGGIEQSLFFFWIDDLPTYLKAKFWKKIAAVDTQNFGQNLQKICSKIRYVRAELQQILRTPMARNCKITCCKTQISNFQFCRFSHLKKFVSYQIFCTTWFQGNVQNAFPRTVISCLYLGMATISIYRMYRYITIAIDIFISIYRCMIYPSDIFFDIYISVVTNHIFSFFSWRKVIIYFSSLRE